MFIEGIKTNNIKNMTTKSKSVTCSPTLAFPPLFTYIKTKNTRAFSW
jgi:hypothetical protein